MSACKPLSFAIIGGGISGLAAANRILELDSTANIVLLEAGPQLGGVLRSEYRDGFLIEHGADNFITTVPWGIEFCKRIGFEKDLVPTNTTHRRAFVVRRGKLQPIPAGFVIMAPSRVWPVVSTPILIPRGKIRLASELFVPRSKSDEDESLASFVTRRLGREAYERLVQPLVAGIYTADPEKLSVNATMPQFREMERKNGSLIRAMWSRKRESKSRDTKAGGARYSQFVAPRAGMSEFVHAAANKLPKNAIHLNSPVEKIMQLPDNRRQVNTGGPTRQQFNVDGIVLALPARHSARLLQNIDDQLANDLSKIRYGSCAIATLGFHKKQIRHPLDGFGVVVPLIEGHKILSASFSSVKYPARAPEGQVLIRTFIGGACQSELLDLDDETLLNLAQNELAGLLDIDGTPTLTHITRRVEAMPQYHIGHNKLVDRITERAGKLNGIALAGNSLNGVGIPHCIHTAEVAVEKLLPQYTQRQYSVSAPS